MSHSERDSWLEELSLGDWPFTRWQFSTLPLRDFVAYFPQSHRILISDVKVLQQRLFRAFVGDESEGPDSSDLLQGLRNALASVIEIVQVAVEVSTSDAHAAWMRHEVWIPSLDESINADEHPAQMLIQSIDIVETNDQLKPQAALGALGLWLVGEWQAYRKAYDAKLAEWALTQAAIALAEAEVYRGMELQRSLTQRAISSKNRIGAEVRHAANRENKQRGRAIWLSREWRFQADAAREIAKQLHIVEEVANRWIREFKRSG